MRLCILLALLLVACSPKGPHVEYICTSSHSEYAVIPMLLPDGNGGSMMYMMPTVTEICDYGFNICVEDNVQVDAKLCKM